MQSKFTLSRIRKHPLDEEFRALGVTRTQLANYLQRPYSSLSTWMGGFSPMPSDVEFRLRQLVQEIRKQRDGGVQ
jgi:hypothetical protein